MYRYGWFTDEELDLYYCVGMYVYVRISTV